MARGLARREVRALPAMPASADADAPAGPTAADLRHVFGQYPTGVAVVACWDAQGEAVAMTINSFASVSLDPPLLLWSLGARSVDLPAFRTATRFGISILSSTQEAVARHFADPRTRRAPGADALLDLAGVVPLVPAAVGTLVCRVERTTPVGDHLLVIGRIEQATAQPGGALAYHRGRYARLDGQAAG